MSAEVSASCYAEAIHQSGITIFDLLSKDSP